MPYRLLFPWMLLALIAGPVLAETVTFAPAIGSARTYHTELSTRLARSDEPPDYFDTQFVSTLTRFEVTGRTDADISLRILPQWVAARIGSDGMNSALQEAPASARALMREGLDATVANGNGALRDIAPHGNVDLPDDIMTQFKDQLGTPAAFSAVEAEPGWTTDITPPGLPRITLTVTKVTPDKVFVHFEGREDFDARKSWTRVAGLAAIDRADGWLDRQVITVESSFDPGDGADRRMHQTVAMVRAGYPHPVQADSAVQASQWREMHSTLPPLKPLASEEQVFGQGRGAILPQDDGLVLTLPIVASVAPNIGRIALHDVRAFEGDQKLDAQILATPPQIVTRFKSDADWQFFSRARLIGGDDAARVDTAATELRARADWYPGKPFEILLHPDASGHADLTQDGVQATLRPLPDSAEGDYELLLSGREYDQFDWAFPKGSGVTGKFYAGDRGPDWLTSPESLARRIAQPEYSAVRLVLKARKLPDTITIRVNRSSESPAASHEVSFQTPRGQRLDPDRQPETRALFGHEPKPDTVDEVQPHGLKQAGFTIRLDSLQARHCKLGMPGNATLAGHGFESALEPADDTTSASQTLVLQTDDGIRRYFYGRGKETVQLSCDARQIWRKASVQPDADRPWQVDPAVLGLTPEATLGDFNAHWRFVNDQGTVLALVSPRGDDRLHSDDRLKRLTFPDGTLRIAGRPVAFLKASLEPEAVNRQFDVTFPDLPQPEPTPWESSGSNNHSDREPDHSEAPQ